MNSKITKVLLAGGLVAGAALVHHFAGAKKSTPASEPSAVEEATSQHEDTHAIGAVHPDEAIGAEVPEFNFVGHDGGRFLSSSLQDKVWVANFIFTSCQSMCPLITKKMQALQGKFADEKSLRIVSFSLDPENDTPLKLKAYGEKYQADMEQWCFVTGHWKEIHGLMQDGLKVVAPAQPASHTDRLVLVDRGMKIAGYYSANDPDDLEKLEQDIQERL
jgi:protein SCO1/2